MTKLTTSKSTPPTRTRRALLGVTATASIFALAIVLLRFAYIPFAGNNDIEGDFMDYPWLSSFLYSAGVELSFLSFSLILAYSTRFMQPRAKRPFMLLAYTIAFVALFFISWVILPETYFSLNQEIAISLICSTLALFSTYQFASFIKSNEERLMSKIRYLMRLMLIDTIDKGHINDQTKYTKDIVQPAITKLREE